MKLIVLLFPFFLSLFVSSVLIGQTNSPTIEGKIINQNTKTPIYLIEDQNVMDSTITDSLGRFSFDYHLNKSKNYFIEVVCSENNSQKFHLEQVKEVGITYVFESSCNIPERFDNNVYFEFNSVNQFENLNVQWIKDLLDKHSQLCLEFSQTIHPKESKELASKRMNYFEKLLIDAGCDIKQIRFSDKVYLLTEYQITQDKRSRIEGVVVSLDGLCE